MDNSKFKELLLNVAVCAIACDGFIDDREIEALHKIEKDSPYFSAIDLSELLDESLEVCTQDLDKFKNSIFEMLDAHSLNIVQELSVLEISLRIILADNKKEEREKVFINALREHLVLEDFLIVQRFGEISYLKPKNSEFKSTSSNTSDNTEVNSK